MSDFPTLVYRCPGEHAGQNGNTYNYMQAEDAAAFDALIAAGWKASLPEACGAVPAKEEVDQIPEADLLAPPTRAELEAKANELGLKFDGRTRDGKLTAMIAEAMKVA